MASKYKVGQTVELKDGRHVTIARVARSIHGNTSLLTLSENGKEWPRPVRTGWLSEAAKK